MNKAGTKALLPPRMLKPKEAAARLGVTVRTLKTYIARGYLRAERLPSPKGMGSR
jgi:predicted site-specific integrase-resolvase